VPEKYINPEGTKPWGTGHALLMAKDVAGLINNKVAISQHIKNKLKNLPKEELEGEY
jgi:hypothetical protein